MAILKANVPRSSLITVEVDKKDNGTIVKDKKEIPINGKICDLIVNLIEENKIMGNMLDYYNDKFGLAEA